MPGSTGLGGARGEQSPGVLPGKWRCSPANEGEQRCFGGGDFWPILVDFRVLPPTVGGTLVHLGGSRGGLLLKISLGRFLTTPPHSGGEHAGEHFWFWGGARGSILENGE